MLRTKKAKYNTFINHHSENTALDTINITTREEIDKLNHNSVAVNYIKSLKIGQFVNFTIRKEQRKIISMRGIVRKKYIDKFCISVKVGESNRIETKLITLNDIIEKTFIDERWDMNVK